MACEAAATKDPAFSGHLDSVIRHREPYVEAVFRELLAPLVPTRTFPEPGDGDFPLQFEQIEDERIPAFSYVAVDDPRAITEGDWVRLAALDDEGDSFTLPYSPEFLGPNPVANFAYDRFWHPTGEKPAQESTHKTRWLCAGYSFVGVGPYDGRKTPEGSDLPEVERSFFSNPATGALAHFRHHYFALGLIAHFQRASLLRFKHDLAEAAVSSRPLPTEPEDGPVELNEFRERTERLTGNFLKFRTVYWFSEVSNQVQGRELFDLFGKHLRLKELFAEVAADIDFAGAVLRQHEEEQQTHSQERLAVLAAGFLVLTPVLDWIGDSLSPNQKVFGAVVLLAILGALTLPVVGKEALQRLLETFPRRAKSAWFYPYASLLAVILVIGVLGLAFGRELFGVPAAKP